MNMPSDAADSLNDDQRDSQATTADTDLSTNHHDGFGNTNNRYEFSYQYQEDNVEYTEDMSDITLSRLQHHWKTTYDGDTNTYCSTRIERYYTRTYN